MRAKNKCLFCGKNIDEKTACYLLAPVERIQQRSKKDVSLVDIKFNVHAKFLVCKDCIIGIVLKKRFDNNLEIYDEMLDAMTLSRDGDDIKIGVGLNTIKKNSTQKDVDELIAKMALERLK